MPNWLAASVDFAAPIAVLVLTRQQFFNEGLPWRPDAPDLMVKAFTDLIAKCRPDLAGGMLCGVHVNWREGAVDFGYYHPSLPPLPPGEAPPRIYLYPSKVAEADTPHQV